MTNPLSPQAPFLRNLRTFAALAAAAALLVPGALRAAPPAGVGPIVLAHPATFEAGVAAIEAATGAKAEPIELGGAPVPPGDGRAFAVDGATAERVLRGSHATFREAGLYLFRLERSFGVAGEKDPLVLLRTADRDAVVRRVGTAGPKSGATTDAIVAWLDALAKDEPFDLTEVGVDYLSGRFLTVPKDPVAVAKRCVQIAPELTRARASTIDLLIEEIRTERTLYLIW